MAEAAEEAATERPKLSLLAASDAVSTDDCAHAPDADAQLNR
jgi:hypothetical protein